MTQEYRINDNNYWILKNIYILIKLYEAIKSKPNSEMSFIPETDIRFAVQNQKFILNVIENYTGEKYYYGTDAKKLQRFTYLDIKKNLLKISLFGSTIFTIKISPNLGCNMFAGCFFKDGSGSNLGTVKYDSVALNIAHMWDLKDDSIKLLQYFESSMRPAIVDILRQSIIDMDW